MKWRHILLVGAAVTPLVGCDVFDSGTEIRYRITVDVITPQGVRSGSGVWSLKLSPGNIDQAYNARIRGEAIPVDLPGGQTIFATMEVPVKLPEDVVARRFFPEARYPQGVGPSRPRQIEYIKEHIRDKIKLNCRKRLQDSECPLIVNFATLTDASSVYELNPENLSSSLGQGYSLGGVYLQITDEQPTRQLETRLPWLDDIKGKNLDGESVRDYSKLSNILTYYSFRRWEK